jgi:uncharacterized membrane protein (GlpM family)
MSSTAVVRIVMMLGSFDLNMTANANFWTITVYFLYLRSCSIVGENVKN